MRPPEVISLRKREVESSVVNTYPSSPQEWGGVHEKTT